MTAAGRPWRFAAIGALALVACSSSSEPRFPEFSALVVDQAGEVPDDVEQTVDAQLRAYQQRSGHQVAIAVVDSTDGDSIEDWSIDLAREWGVGTEGDDDGVLLVIAYDDRRMRIEVGRGVEDELTDLEAGRIIREQLRPRLQQDDVGGAVAAGASAIRVALGDEDAQAPTAPVQEQPRDDTPGFPFWIVPLGFVLLGGLGGGFGRRRRRGGWGEGLLLGGMLGGMGRGWGGGGGGGFGGFGGGGGGGFGGGGASGDW